MQDESAPKLYSELASWWPLLSAPGDYAEEAAIYRAMLVDACEKPPRTMLELGSGGGNNASHMKAHFQLTLVDRSAGMLAVSAALNPECEHIEADMRTVRLDRQFDCVFVHDAVTYLNSRADLRRMAETAFLHCCAGGAALFAPDFVRENFRALTEHGGHDGADRSLRYLTWTWDPDPSDDTYITDFAYLLRSPDGAVHAEHDRHIAGLFARTDWLEILGSAGFATRAVPLRFSEPATEGLEIFVGKKPAADRYRISAA